MPSKKGHKKDLVGAKERMLERATKSTIPAAIEINLGSPNSEKQWAFMLSKKRYTCYGGARGGGKSFILTRRIIASALKYKGIGILVIRREYRDMENSIIDPILKVLPPAVYNYNKTDHVMTFINGSKVTFSNMPDYNAAVGGKLQGSQYDMVCIDEATQFLESEFRGLCAICRGTSPFPKQVFLTCNPGGVGHAWVKRLFVDGKFNKDEDPKDYLFIHATVDDNVDLIKADPEYVKVLDNLPEDIRKAHRYGDWSALAGTYFEEFRDELHTCKPFTIPKNWKRYRAMDYGLDMFYCLWVAVNENGRCYVYRSFNQKGMIVSDAARKQLELTPIDEGIDYTIAPPDMWSRSSENGKSPMMTFAENGVALFKADNDRERGWYALKELMKVQPDGKPNIIIFETLTNLTDCIKALMHDKTNPNDVSKQPHDITHGPDALRYFAKSFTMAAEVEKEHTFDEDEDFYHTHDYQTEMCGVGCNTGYLL